ASAFTLLVGFCVVGFLSIVLFGLLAGIGVGVTRYCTRRLGGVTGDTLGAVGELVETAAFCLFGALTSGGGAHYRLFPTTTPRTARGPFSPAPSSKLTGVPFWSSSKASPSSTSRWK